MITWEPPSAGWIKLNVDDVVPKAEGMGSGAVAHDEKGQFLMMAVSRERVQWPPELPKIKAIAFCIQ
ncbi:unnamed protein product [Linum trigynum]|uniref:RNase H type-1 domain-containing protein n=1 Tax=Linum trigynum TaxID=586398 RepID=A0AAV2EUX1_9ROSI